MFKNGHQNPLDGNFFHFGKTRVIVYVITNSTTKEESQPITI
jgi:hypothetical protein